MRRRFLFYVLLCVSCFTSTSLLFLSIRNFDLTSGMRNNGPFPQVGFHNREEHISSRGKLGSKFDKDGASLFPPKSRRNVTAPSPLEEIGGVLVYNDMLQSGFLRNVSELYSRVVPNNVFFVWCGRRAFEFQHYLAILGVWYHLEPDVIEIRYDSPPVEDKYNTWLSMLRTNIPVLSLQPLPGYATRNRCSPFFGLELVLDRGGIFVNDGVILHSNTPSGLNYLLETETRIGFFPDLSIAWVAATQKSPVLNQYMDTFLASGRHSSATYEKLKPVFSDNNISLTSCSRIQSTVSQANEIDEILRNQSSIINEGINGICIRFEHSQTPVDFLRNITNPLVVSLKSLLYGPDLVHSALETPTHRREVVEKIPIPFVIHYVWFGRKVVSFSMYLSFLSSVNIIRPSALLIHTDLRLEGSYWETIRNHHLVHLVYREPPRTIFGHRVVYTQHRSDVVRADVLDKYGGIYLDWDAFWVKPLNNLLNSRQDVILSRDHIPRLPFPDTINMGVVLARPRSTFIRRWRASLVNYKSFDFLYNAVELPYKAYETYPHTVFLYDRLQAICYFLKCHPSFHPDFKHWGEAQPFDWKTDVHALHFTHPDPPAFHNESTLRQSRGMFADLGNYIWNSPDNKP